VALTFSYFYVSNVARAKEDEIIILISNAGSDVYSIISCEPIDSFVDSIFKNCGNNAR